MLSSYSAAETEGLDGISRRELAAELRLMSVLTYGTVASTMDIAHAAAESGAATPLLVVADAQERGRGREGRRWESASGGLWFTLLVTNTDPDAARVLALRCGLAVRDALQPHADERMLVKWPNDIWSATGKVAGILVEARWRDARPEWIAIGVGVNMFTPELAVPTAALKRNVRRGDVLADTVPLLLAAARCAGALNKEEVQQFVEHDYLRGREIDAPVSGTVLGISEDGELVVSTSRGLATISSGTVVLRDRC